MVDHISNSNDIYTNNTIKQQQELLGIDKKTVSKNPYAQLNELADQTDISDEAFKLYERDKEISRFKNMVLDSFDPQSSLKEISDLINSGKYEISNDDLADSLLNNEDFTDMLFSDENIM